METFPLTRRTEFARRLQLLRERKRVSRKALGELCGLSKGQIGRYERGERVPDIETAREIADFFGVSLDYLCGSEKNFEKFPKWGTQRFPLCDNRRRAGLKPAPSFTIPPRRAAAGVRPPAPGAHAKEIENLENASILCVFFREAAVWPMENLNTGERRTACCFWRAGRGTA